MILATQRLRLREMTDGDFTQLCAIMQDPQAMIAYEGAFDDRMTRDWLQRMEQRYRQDGFGLWAVVLAGTDEMIGQCGLTRQRILGEDVIEVGYLFNRAYWHRGYATESARACRDYAFDSLGVERLYAQVRDMNIASMNVAIRLGMTVRGRFEKEFRGVRMPHFAFAVDCGDRAGCARSDERG